MNTIKFSKINNTTTEMHNLELQNIYEDTIFGKKIKLYHPCNLNIFVTELCQNNCDFCINKQINESLNDLCNVLNTNLYCESLEKILKEIANKHFEITITGGEPTLDIEKFVKTMQLCKKYNIPCRTISTTGYQLMKNYDNKPLCQHMIDNGFIHNINISRMHWNETLNHNILKGKNLTNDEIQKLALFFKLNDAEMRISCNLILGYIDCFEKMLEYVDFYRNRNIETIMFRELIGKDPILLKDILELNEENGFHYFKTLDGFLYTVDVYQYQDMLVKHYITKKQFDKDVIFSFAFKNNLFMDNFTGKNICIKMEGE